MRYCSSCGSTVQFRIPEGDDRSRYVCGRCGDIHYVNPRIVAGTIPVWDDRILLCRRAIEPRYGFWTLPAGFMENSETTSEAAIRETWEEARARVELEGLYSVMNVPHIDQVHMYFLARMLDEDFSSGDESLEVALFHERDLPWDELAFPTVTSALERFFEERRSSSHFRLLKDHDIRRPLKKL